MKPFAPAFSAVMALALGAAAPLPTADLLIKGGTIYDGSDSPGFVGDVAITGDKVSFVGPSAKVQARRTINATGMVVAPGFIDPHTHAEISQSADPTQRRLDQWLTQGVTTIVTGNDGWGEFDIAGQTRALTARPIGPNLASFVGFGPVRVAVLGETDIAPNAAQLAKMQGLVAIAMCEGALGLSTGLFYPPQKFAATDEVIAVAKEAGQRGGLYDTHQRDESSYGIGLLASTEEAIRIGREAGTPVHFAHLKALGVDVHGKAPEVIARIDAARVAGQEVTADQYPYTAGGSSLTAALLPGWAQDGGIAAIKTRIDDPAQRDRLRAAMTDNLRRRGGPGAILLTVQGRSWSGKRLDEIASTWSVDPIDAALRIIRDDPEGDRTATFTMTEPDIDAFMRQPWMMTGSDGIAGHPRMYGTFPEKYARYVVARQVISLPTFIRQSTGRTADYLRLDRRGYLRPGWFADVVVFDPAKFAARSDYARPRELAVGVKTLLINGEFAVDEAKLNTNLPGRVLRRTNVANCPQKGSGA
jgi:N-acyl-D-amino-acid deacylase